jgi:hypothetical protein
MMIVVLVNRLINSTKVSTNFNLINNYIRFVDLDESRPVDRLPYHTYFPMRSAAAPAG